MDRFPAVFLIALLAAGCSDPPLEPVAPAPWPPRVEEVLGDIRARPGDACWLIPELFEEAAIGIDLTADGARIERVDFAVQGDGRRLRADLDGEATRAFVRRLEENGWGAPPPATPSEGVRIWCRLGGREADARFPRGHPLAEVFRQAADDAGLVFEPPIEGEAEDGTVRALESGPAHLVDPVFGPDGRIYAKAGAVVRFDDETGRFVRAFPFPPDIDRHAVQWRVPTRTLLAFHESRVDLDLTGGIPFVSPGERYATSVRPSAPGSALVRIDLATDRRTDVLRAPRPIAAPVVDDEGRWFAFGLLPSEPGGPIEVRVFDAGTGLEFEPSPGPAAVHRPIAYSPDRRTFTFYRREIDGLEYEIYLWSVERREVEFVYVYHPSEFQVLSILDDGRAVARKAFVQPPARVVWRLGVFDFYSQNFAPLSATDGQGPGSLHPAGDRFVYAHQGDVFLWRSRFPGHGPR